MQYKQVDGSRQNLPKSWTLKKGTLTGNFDIMSEEVHNDEGWYQCLDDPTVETPETHKLGVDTLVAKRWVRAVVVKTAQDLSEDAAKAALVAAKEAEDADIAAAILDSSLGDLTYEQLEATTLGQSSIIRKLGRVVWALLKERNKGVL